MAINNQQELKTFFSSHDYPSYDRNNFDDFVEDKKFEFNIHSIHITGTNGKGSTANYIREIYIAHGYNVGFFNSPFLSSPLEMISFNNQNISFEEYVSLLNPMLDDIERYHLSSFEIQTLIAYQYFINHQVDLAVVEVGMGGAIDATNILNKPLLAIITSVSLEHTAYLGSTISAIADAKAGIIKPGSRVLVSQLGDEAMYPIYLHVKKCHCDLHVVNDYHNEKFVNGGISFDYRPYKELFISTLATYQLKNASLAVEASNLLNDILPINEQDVRTGLATACLPSRLEMISSNVCVDGAHNPEAIESLMESLLKITDKPIHVIYAAFKDKNIDTILSILNRDCSSVTITTFAHPRARNKDDYFLYLDDYNFEEDYKHAIDEEIEKFPDDFILITGSLAFSNYARRYLLGLDK